MKKFYSLSILLLLSIISVIGQGTWTQKANFIGTPRSRAVRFTINNQIYYGSGNIVSGNPESNDFYKYDIATNTWSQIASLPQAMQAGVGFSIGNKGYAGIGWLNGNAFSNFYEYDPTLNTWTLKASWPGPLTNDANSFVINGKGYVGGGDGPYGNPTISDFYEYNPSTDIWTQKANIPSPGRRSSGTFTIGNYGFLGGGSNDDLQQAFNDYYKYNPANNLWTSIANFPASIESRNCGFSMSGSGYSTAGMYLNQIFKYDTTLNNWIRINVPANINFIADMGEEVNGKVYFSKTATNEFWEWDPNGIVTIENGVCDTLINGTANYSDFFGQNVISSDGNIVVVGTENLINNWSSGDIYLKKYDSNFNLIWSRSFYSGGGMDVAGGVLQTSDGGYLINRSFGNSNPNGMFSAGYIIKTDSSGNQQWVHTLIGQSYGDNYSSTAVENSNGEFICYGHVQHHNGCATGYQNGYATRITKLASNGNEVWSYCLNINPDWVGGFDKLQNSNNYISTYGNQGTGAVEIRKFNDNGSQIAFFSYQFNLTSITNASVRRCKTGGFYLFGSLNVPGGNDALIAKFDDNLNLIWEHSYNKNAIDVLNELIETSDSKIFATGYSGTSTNYELYVLKTDSSGNFIADKSFGLVASSTMGFGISQLLTGELICTGFTESNSRDELMIKICDMNSSPCILPSALINATGSLTICMGDSVQLNANTGPGLTYQWLLNGTGIPFATNSNYFAKQQGNYSLVVSSGINCSTTSAPVSVTVNPKYSNSVSTSICQGNSFTLPDGQIVNASGIYTTTLHSISYCDSVIITNLSVNPCLQHANCTYSQGFYGSANGSNACNGQTKLQLINSLLPTNLIIGAASRKITFSNGDAQCIINKMPGNSTPAKLPLGNVSCSNASGNQYLTGSGKFKNVLLGQTIALGLNMRYDTTLKNVSLDGKYFTTSASTGCGSGTVIAGTQRTFYIPQSVLTYLGTHHTVQDLFNLANNALGGVYNPTGCNPSLSAINSALDALNKGFEGCRILVRFSNSCARLIGDEPENPSSISLIAYPNPFGNEITISYQSESSTDATIIIKDITGRTLKLYEHVTENITVGNDFKPGIYFVELIQGNNYKLIKIIKTHE